MDVKDRLYLIWRSGDILEVIGKSDKPCFTDIVKETGISKSTVSKYLNELVELGIIKRKITKKDQRVRYYELIENNDLSGGSGILLCPNCDMVLTKKDIVNDQSDSDKIQRVVYCKSCGIKLKLDLEIVDNN